MATCKDCAHVEVCISYLREAYKRAHLATPDLNSVLSLRCDDCDHFKGSSRFVELPCKVGDILFVPTRNFISEYKIDYFHVGAYGIWFNTTLIAGISTHLRSENIESIGKTVFLTREESEQALKEREENE